MARRILYLLMMVIAVQFSWAVITSYCMHESGKASQHFGHHEHVDGADELASVSKEKSDTAKKAAGHTHCSLFSHGALSPDSIPSCAFPALLTSLETRHTVASLSSSDTIPPERPQWPTAV